MATKLAREWRFIDSPRLSAKDNMRKDESLFLTCGETPIFRLYEWEDNSFSIGRFQKVQEIKNLQSYGDDWAKRITGGGLLLHGFDVSYALILPITQLGNKSVKESYEYLCEFILNFYRNLGFTPAWAKDILANSLSKSFFCQEGFEPYDIIINDKKIGGNAQRRTKGFLLQHGSIPLRKDTREHSGISLEEFGIKLNPKEAKKMLAKSFEKTFGAILKKEEL